MADKVPPPPPKPPQRPRKAPPAKPPMPPGKAPPPPGKPPAPPTKAPPPPGKAPSPPSKPPAPPSKTKKEGEKTPPKRKPKPKAKPRPKGKPKPKGKPTKKKKKKGRRINIKLNLRQKKITDEDDSYSDQIGWTSMAEDFEDYEDPTPQEPEIVTHQCTMCGAMMRIPRPKRERYKVICAHPECGHSDFIGI
jgi:hypothetical protein